eukprot:Skav211790  [mRNA]  locus=scaffold305:207263:218185:+ [translate_table: standard]
MLRRPSLRGGLGMKQASVRAVSPVGTYKAEVLQCSAAPRPSSSTSSTSPQDGCWYGYSDRCSRSFSEGETMVAGERVARACGPGVLVQEPTDYVKAAALPPCSSHDLDAMGCCYQRLPVMTLQERPHLGTFGAAVLIAKVNWGIGMIAMPFYLHSAGLGAGLLFFVLSMFLALDAALVMHRLSWSLQETSYVPLIRKGLGLRSSRLAAAAVLLAGWGSAVAWLKFMGDNVARFAGGPAALNVALLTEITILERFSCLGLVFGQCFVLLLFILAVQHSSQWPSYVGSQPFVRTDSFPVAMGIAVFCNEGMVVMSSEVSGAMQREAEKGFKWAGLMAVGYFTVNYLLLALCGDFLYSYLPGLTFGELALEMRHGVARGHAVRSLCGDDDASDSGAVLRASVARKQLAHGKSRVWRVALVLSCGACAAVLPRFGDFLAIFGAVANSVCIYIFPHLTLLWSKADGDEADPSMPLAAPGTPVSTLRRVWSWFVVTFFGVFCGLLAAVVSVQQLL